MPEEIWCGPGIWAAPHIGQGMPWCVQDHDQLMEITQLQICFGLELSK